MRIYIPTIGRVQDQITFRNLPTGWQARTFLVVSKEEQLQFVGYPIIVCPYQGKGSLGKVRHWIYETHNEIGTDGRFIMMDDDISFYIRRTDDPGKFLNATRRQVGYCIDSIFESLKRYSHVGVISREGGNRRTEDFTVNTRLNRVLGYNAMALNIEEVHFDRMLFMDDFDVALQLLRAGRKNLCLGMYAQGHRSSNEAGGCSLYRTMEMQRKDALLLKKLHPEFVTVVQKQTKTAWGGQPRTDVRIAWKKAYESSK